MLEVKVILHHAVTGEVREIANMRIVNDGSGDALVGNYYVAAWRERGDVKEGAAVRGHERSMSVWQLIHKAIRGLRKVSAR